MADGCLRQLHKLHMHPTTPRSKTPNLCPADGQVPTVFKAFSGNTVNLGEKFKIDFSMRYFISG